MVNPFILINETPRRVRPHADIGGYLVSSTGTASFRTPRYTPRRFSSIKERSGAFRLGKKRVCCSAFSEREIRFWFFYGLPPQSRGNCSTSFNPETNAAVGHRSGVLDGSTVPGCSFIRQHDDVFILVQRSARCCTCALAVTYDGEERIWEDVARRCDAGAEEAGGQLVTELIRRRGSGSARSRHGAQISIGWSRAPADCNVRGASRPHSSLPRA